MRRSLAILLSLVAIAPFIGATAAGSTTVDLPASPVGRHVAVHAAVHHDVSPPLRDLAAARGRSHVHPALRTLTPAQAIVRARDTSGTRRRRTIPSPIANFDGISQNGFIPPDTQLAAGTTQVFEMANVDIAVYSKTGTVIIAPEPANTLWSGFGGGCQTNNDGDGIVLWDAMAQRWVISQFSVSTTPFLECVAVSQTTDATGVYNRYSFSYGSTTFPDYPKMGVWPDGYYVSFNLFNFAGTQALGTELCAYDRAKMLTGAAATQQCFIPFTSGTQTQLPASLDGTVGPSAGENEYFAGLSTIANNLMYFKFHVDWTTPGNSSLTGPTNLAVTAFSQACGGGTCIPQQGTVQQLDSLGERVMARLAYRNFGDHESLVVNHSIVAGSSVGVRWYELRVSGGNLTVFQQGTYAPDTAYRWMGSIAMDASGDMALGFSISSGTTHPGIRYTGRLVGDPLGQMPQGEGTFITGAGSQTGSHANRWGDYSAMSVDPTDDCTLWYANEYLPATGVNWHTRIASFVFPSCTPAPVTNGGFETGDFAGWTTGGSVAPSIVTTGAHSGADAAKLGSSAGTHGDSSIQQTIAVPGDGGTLTFWYQPHCPDSFRFDQETVQIKDTLGAVLATVLNGCGNSGVWTQRTFDLGAFAGQTVVLFFHNTDSGYAASSTYTLIDDVSVA